MSRRRRYCSRCEDGQPCAAHDHPERNQLLCPDCGSLWGTVKKPKPTNRKRYLATLRGKTPVWAVKPCMECRKRRKPMFKTLTELTVNQILEWREKGARAQTIAVELGISVSTVQRVWSMRDIW